jgi:hypothetical protein
MEILCGGLSWKICMGWFAICPRHAVKALSFGQRAIFQFEASAFFRSVNGFSRLTLDVPG